MEVEGQVVEMEYVDETDKEEMHTEMYEDKETNDAEETTHTSWNSSPAALVFPFTFYSSLIPFLLLL